MKATLTVAGNPVEVRETLLDRAIRYLAPIHGQKRFHSRLRTAMIGAVAGGYTGASGKRSLASWRPSMGDPDSALMPDLSLLRDRSSDLVRNDPMAGGAINTAVTNIVGTGLKLQARIDRTILGMSEDEADAWERQTEAEWRLFFDTVECDSSRTLTGHAMQELVLRSTLERGDVFTLLPSIARPGSPYRLKLQVIEGDRVCNPHSKADTDRLVGGVEKDEFGAPVRYHIMTTHPGRYLAAAKREWAVVEAFGAKTGRRNIIHSFRVLRPNQTRGVPYLAPVMDALKNIGRYTQAEIDAAVISSFLTVFVKSESGEMPAPMTPTGEVGGSSTDEDIKLGPAAVIGLARDEDVSVVNPGRPNTAFDPFIQAVFMQIGMALEIPHEVLVKKFIASYSAAKAAMQEAWKFFSARRAWLARTWCDLVYEAWMHEAVALGRINAPGFLTDPLLRRAYLGAAWIGPARGMINEMDEVKAAELRIQTGLSTLDEETAQLTGGDFERNHSQRVKEVRMRRADGLDSDPNRSNAAVGAGSRPNGPPRGSDREDTP